MSMRTIDVPFPYINFIMKQDAANKVFLIFQREAPDKMKYLAIHTQTADGKVSAKPLLENHDMYELRGVMFHPDGTPIVYGANRNRSKIIKIDIPDFVPLLMPTVLAATITRLTVQLADALERIKGLESR